ncbi:MAG TPA: prepilin-type N-terminal cleavage/methylation domain-containing protein [Methylophaga sp.]|nr:MAG: pilus assembly protein MshD [Gammaproteobacteria bacterium]HHA18426.1 prepilin-type N-terminal cleavage/methylation domain-containing protein [Methylophaga sp.]
MKFLDVQHKTVQQNQQGTTLVELVISIVIISIALAGILSVINLTIMHSADPMIRQQAVAIAQSYIEEIQLHSYCDPDGGCGCTGTGGPEASRDLYDNICDYHNLSDTGAKDQDNNAITGLSEYSIDVSIAETAFYGIASAQALKIEVDVTHSSNLIDFKLTAFRTQY